ncbi:MAG TPA: MlaD family protein [Fibrobacteraceae bacterium]|nr:MlaD family protein [Fibrobacteraceae bacterium]
MNLFRRFKTIRWMEFSGLLVGAALATVFILLLTVVVLTLRVQGFGSEEYNLYCVFNKGLGLRVGTKIQVNGVEVGKVSALELTPESRVLLTFSIKKKYSDWVVRNAMVYATRDQNLIAERIINIDPPKDMKRGVNPALSEGDTLIAGQAQDIETVIEKAVGLLETADTLARKANTLLDNALDPKSSLGALVNSRELYDQLQSQLEKVDRITSGGKALVDSAVVRLPPLLDKTDSLVGLVSQVGTKLDTVSLQAMGLLHSVDTTLFAVDSILVDLKGLTRNARNLLVDGESKLESANDLMTGLGSFWFIRNRLPRKDTVPLFGSESW